MRESNATYVPSMETNLAESSLKDLQRKALKLQLIHLKTLSRASIKANIPMPYAAVFSCKGTAISKSLDPERSSKITKCCRCALQLENSRSFYLKIMKDTTRSKKKIRVGRSRVPRSYKLKKRKVHTLLVFAICKGCGCHMNCGFTGCVRSSIEHQTSKLQETDLSFVALPRRNELSSALHPTSRGASSYTPFLKRILTSKETTWSLSRRKKARKLQQMLLSEKDSLKVTNHSLSDFLKSLQV